jgi:TonB family protein
MPRFEIVTLPVFLMCATWAQMSPAQTAEPKAAHPPVAIASPDPEYPPDARSRMLNGQCTVSLLVDTNGEPQDAKIVSCSDAVFGPSSLMAVGKYRFQPARDDDRRPVAVRVSIEIDFRLEGISTVPLGDASNKQFRYGIGAPPAGVSSKQLSKGVYPLSAANENPKLVSFPDETFTGEAFRYAHGVNCEVVLTINRKGAASDPGFSHCTEPAMEGPAVSSLLGSKFSPARLNGKTISVRVIVELAYLGNVPES